MKTISSMEIKNYYIKKYKIDEIFDKEILEHSQLHFYNKEEYILEAQTKLTYFYLLVEGKIKIYYPFENGKSMLLKFYSNFNTIGDIELLKDIPILCNIDAVEDTYLLAIPTTILKNNCFNNVKFLNHLVNSLSDKLCATINNSSYNFVYPLINRFSSYLVEYLTDKNYIILHSSYLEIAQFLGTTYRHLNRTIKEMESQSILKCENKMIYILNEQKLKELSKNYYIKPL